MAARYLPVLGRSKMKNPAPSRVLMTLLVIGRALRVIDHRYL